MTKTKSRKVVVSKPALMARINRRLQQDDERLYAARSARAKADLGDYYVVRFGRGSDEPATNIVKDHVDPVDLARELGLIHGFEEAE
jgi:hypothetical protein